jgi:hypothetical protein
MVFVSYGFVLVQVQVQVERKTGFLEPIESTEAPEKYQENQIVAQRSRRTAAGS